MDAITLLRRDHDEMLAIFQVLETGAGLTGADLAARKDLVARLVATSARHEAAEDQHFWPVVRSALPDGEQLADHAQRQETDARQLLDELDRTKPTEPAYGDLVDRFVGKARKHIAYEQELVWPALAGVLTSRELNELGEKLARAKDVAPAGTRSHPAPTWAVVRMR